MFRALTLRGKEVAQDLALRGKELTFYRDWLQKVSFHSRKFDNCSPISRTHPNRLQGCSTASPRLSSTRKRKLRDPPGSTRRNRELYDAAFTNILINKYNVSKSRIS